MEATGAMTLLLVRHAEPHIVPERPAGTWHLNNAGRAGARGLVPCLAPERPDIVVTSREPKAQETGAIIADALGLPLREHDGLGEQGGDTVPWIESAEDFRAAVRAHFDEPSGVVLGAESADDAAARFARAVADLPPDVRCPILVSHGRIMVSYLASVLGVDAWPIWADLRLPDALAVDLDAGTMRRLAAE